MTGFQLHDERDFTADGGKDLRKQRDIFRRPAQGQLLQFLIGQGVHSLIDAADPLQVVVVEDDDFSVFGELDVEFDPVSGLHSGAERGQGILRYGLVFGK